MTFAIGWTKITLQFSFFLVLSLFLLADKSGWAWVMLLSIFLHEVSHLFMMWLFHVRVEEITFCPFGINIRREPAETLSYWKECWIYMAGPLCNLLLAVGGWIFSKRIDNIWLSIILCINLVIGIFQLIPIVPLDGGQIFRCLTYRFLPLRTAQKWSDWLGFFILTPIAIYAILLFFRTGNFTLLLLCLSLLLQGTLQEKDY